MCEAIPPSEDGSGAPNCSAANVGLPVLVNKLLARCNLRMCLGVVVCFSMAGLESLDSRCACVIFLAKL